MLLGYKTKQDLDKLVHRLEENHGLLTHMAENEDDAEASSALPKLLLELVSQVDENEETGKSDNVEELNSSADDAQIGSEIISMLLLFFCFKCTVCKVIKRAIVFY